LLPPPSKLSPCGNSRIALNEINRCTCFQTRLSWRAFKGSDASLEQDRHNSKEMRGIPKWLTKQALQAHRNPNQQ
jgi:hypothetical protein